MREREGAHCSKDLKEELCIYYVILRVGWCPFFAVDGDRERRDETRELKRRMGGGERRAGKGREGGEWRRGDEKMWMWMWMWT